ncbi:MAG: D-2-hydroxyacid dehydrogenase, partial [Hyphomicrobiaceae bacterium]
EVKDFRSTWQFQAEKNWQFRTTEKLEGSNAVVFGVGSIGREIATVLNANGVNVTGVGRTRRSGDPQFAEIFSQSESQAAVADADWVIGVMPLTDQTRNFFDAEFFTAMKSTARFVNVGRGPSVNESDLRTAITEKQIAGAMLDVFQEEPLPNTSPLWDLPGLVVSPHMSGDYAASQRDMVIQFLDNLERFMAGKDLVNVVNKNLGFVHADQT